MRAKAIVPLILVVLFASLLRVSYAWTPINQLTIQGPYYDNEAVANAYVTVSVYYVNDTIYTFTLNGTDLVADTVNITNSFVTSEITQVTWNASSALNITRFWDVKHTDTYLQIHIPTPTATVYAYYFNIADFYGMTEAFMETEIYNGFGVNPVIESRKLTTGTVSFILSQYTPIRINVINFYGTNDESESFSTSFIPENVVTIDFPILPGSFPVANISGVSASASRPSPTTIQANYSDGDSITSWLYFAITHVDSGVTLTDYELELNSTNSYSLTWNLADATLDYTVNITSIRNGVIYPWLIALPHAPSNNPWSGALDFLWADWIGENGITIDSAQVIACFLILLCLGIGSFKTAGASCIVAWIVGAILFAMGWWAPSIPVFSLAFVISIFVAMSEGKQEIREV